MTSEAWNPAIVELGHVGLRCADIDRQLRFYTETLGLTVTDHDEQLGIWFLSARPETEHHELLLAKGRDVPREGKLIQQISFRCGALDDVMAFYRRFRAADVPLDMVVSHGNAVGVYFYDPEGNRCEVYWQTGLDARQPFVENIDLNQSPDAVLAQVRASVERFGREGFTEGSYVAWTKSFDGPEGGDE
jgi:catechol 2,3-dioxygenase-like lactoylglutathione lyase family enzyme